MKNFIILLLASVFYLISCHTLTYKDFGIEERLWLFANDIIEHPERIKELKNNYPDLYNEEYILDKLSETSKDTSNINYLISYINENYNKRNYSPQNCNGWV